MPSQIRKSNTNQLWAFATEFTNRKFIGWSTRNCNQSFKHTILTNDIFKSKFYWLRKRFKSFVNKKAVSSKCKGEWIRAPCRMIANKAKSFKFSKPLDSLRNIHPNWSDMVTYPACIKTNDILNFIWIG